MMMSAGPIRWPSWVPLSVRLLVCFYSQEKLAFDNPPSEYSCDARAFDANHDR